MRTPPQSFGEQEVIKTETNKTKALIKLAPSKIPGEVRLAVSQTAVKCHYFELNVKNLQRVK